MNKIGGALGWWLIGTFLMGFPMGLMALAIWAIDGDGFGFAVWAGMGALCGLAIWNSERSKG